MTLSIFTILLWFSAIGSGLIAGLYFSFSTFIMTAFARIPQEQGISAMQSINLTIVRSLFLPLFFGTALASLLLAGLALFHCQAAAYILSVCFFARCFSMCRSTICLLPSIPTVLKLHRFGPDI